MKFLLFKPYVLMEEAGGAGGGGAGGAGAGAGGAGAGAGGAGAGGGGAGGGGGSAAAQHIQGDGAGAGAGGAGAGGGGGGSAAAQHIQGGGGAGGKPTEPADVDLEKIDDDGYAKIVQPDEEGKEVDRTLITPMAAELRKAGIQPSVMAKIAPIYRKAVSDALAKDEAAREQRMKELTAQCEKEVSAEEWEDFGAAWKDHIAGDKELERIFTETELGSNPKLIKLIALAGATLRGEKTPPATAAAGSSQIDLERSVFEATVPKDLR